MFSSANVHSSSKYRFFTNQLQVEQELKFPTCVVFDPYHGPHQSSQQQQQKKKKSNKNGCIIVADWKTNCLQWFDRLTLRHLTTYSKKGTELGQFNEPQGLCLQPITNRLVVCDSGNHRVQVLSLDDGVTPLPLFDIGRKPIKGCFTKKGEFYRPSGVCCSPNGDIHVTDSSNHRVQSFDCAGRFFSTFGSRGVSAQYFFSPGDICFVHPHFSPSSLASGIFCVSDTYNKRVSVWSGNNTGPSVDSSQHLFNFKVPGNSNGLCVDLKGYLHVSCGRPSHVVQIFDLRMVRSTNFTRSKNSSTNFTRSTNPCTIKSTSSTWPTSEPALIQTLGKDRGRGGEGSRPREFICPAGMCVDHVNTLIVADMFNNRMQFFQDY